MVHALAGKLRSPIRAVLAAVIGLLLVGASAAPALADDGSPDAGYFVSSVTQVRPAVPGLQVSVDAQGRISVVNHTTQTVVVIGYAGEDYLRIGPSGAEENTASLSSAINSRQGKDPLPPQAGGGATKQATAHWVKRTDQPSFSWRDYRALWTSQQRPPIVLEDPHGVHTVSSWALNLRVGTTPVLVLGQVQWTGIPWVDPGWVAALCLLLALILVAVLIVFLRRRRRNRPRTGPDAGNYPGTGVRAGTTGRVAEASRPAPVPMSGPHG
jgi:hypothetical protein